MFLSSQCFLAAKVFGRNVVDVTLFSQAVVTQTLSPYQYTESGQTCYALFDYTFENHSSALKYAVLFVEARDNEGHLYTTPNGYSDVLVFPVAAHDSLSDDITTWAVVNDIYEFYVLSAEVCWENPALGDDDASTSAYFSKGN